MSVRWCLSAGRSKQLWTRRHQTLSPLLVSQRKLYPIDNDLYHAQYNAYHTDCKDGPQIDDLDSIGALVLPYVYEFIRSKPGDTLLDDEKSVSVLRKVLRTEDVAAHVE